MSLVHRKILILSGKGGVGKSTFCAQLAWAFAADDACQTGIMDVDICGPSIPTILGIASEQIHASSSGWSPVYITPNLSAISIGGFRVPVQTDKEVAAPVEDDPFETDPMLAMPKFRFTRSAPPTPSRKLVADRHIGYYVLQPSLSVPIDMDVFG